MMHDDSRHEPHLLPPNASRLERAVSLTTDPLSHLGPASEALIDFKTHPADALLPWLIWEYGLGELLPYPNPTRWPIRRPVSSDCGVTASCPVCRWGCCISVTLARLPLRHHGAMPPVVTALSGAVSPGPGCAGQRRPGTTRAK